MKLALVVVALSGCTSTSTATFGDLPDLRVDLDMSAGGDKSPAEGFLTLRYDAEAFGSCVTLTGLHATRNGEALSDANGGGPDGDGGCIPPVIGIIDDLVGEQTFVIEDGSTVVTAVFPAELFIPRVPILVSPATWVFAPGDPFVVEWPVPMDLGGAPASGLPQVGFYPDQGSYDIDVHPMFSGSRIMFDMPASSVLPVTGNVPEAGKLSFDFGSSLEDATTCSNATSCQAAIARGYFKQATFLNQINP